MFGYTRGWVLLPLLALLLSACSEGIGSPSAPSASSAAVGSDDVALSTRTALAALDSAPILINPGQEVICRLPIHPNAKSMPFLINFVSGGEAQKGVPCFSCVSGAQTKDNVGLTGPDSYIPTGATWQYTLSFTDITFKGTCKLAWAIAAGKKVIDQFAVTVKITQAGGFALYGINRGRPSYSGSAVLTGKVTCGSGAPQTTQTALLFE
jgi:hypothetical protein